MKRLTAWCSLLSICAVTGTALAGSPLIDPPTPPPCAADGTCYPNTCRWGFYPARWRTWPGAELVPEPTSAAPTPAEEPRVSPELGHSETPPPELEDAAAPPSSPKHEPPPTTPAASESTETPPAGSGDGLPPGMPNVPLPDAETPPTSPLTAPPTSPLMAPPASPLTAPPTSEADPPPALPSAFSARTRQGRSTSDRQAMAPIVRKSGVSRVTSGDPPPSPPWVHSTSL